MAPSPVTIAVKPGLSFAKVAAAANDKPEKAGLPTAKKAAPNPVLQQTTTVASAATIQTGPQQSARNSPHTLPVSEENINQLAIAHQSSNPGSTTRHVASRLTSAAPSIVTFPNDEKESLRPDDSASLKDAADSDARPSGDHSPITDSNSDVRAFHDQLSEIDSVDQACHATPSMNRVSPAVLPNNPAMPYQNIPYLENRPFPNLPSGPVSDMAPYPVPMLEPDQRLIEALFSKDRLWLLKLEQDIIAFVHDSSNSFYRMLAHRVSDYYYLAHTIVESPADRSQTVVRLLKTPSTRLPPPLIGYGGQPTSTEHNANAAPMKILRRDDTRPSSSEGATANGDGDSGSEASRSKAQITREERTARYEAARLRIMGSARPSETDLTSTKDDESRTGMASTKRKPSKRTGNDDGFEARSAYNTFRNSSTSTTPMDPSPSPHVFPSADRGYPHAGQMGPFGGPSQQNEFYPPPLMNPDSDSTGAPSPTWNHHPHTNDMSHRFAHSMTLQSPPNGYPSTQPMMYPPHPSWGSGMYSGQQVPDMGLMMYPYGNSMSPMPHMNSDYSHPHIFSPQHFNAQSQAFVPGGQGAPNGYHGVHDYDRRAGPRPGSGPAPGPYADSENSSGFGPSRQNSTRQSRPETRNQPDETAGRGIGHPGTSDHSCGNSNGSTAGNSSGGPRSGQQAVRGRQSGSTPADSIHKWATPASLPAKPPVPASMSVSRTSPGARLSNVGAVAGAGAGVTAIAVTEITTGSPAPDSAVGAGGNAVVSGTPSQP